MKFFFAILTVTFILSACGGSNSKGELQGDEFPLSNLECSGTIAGVDSGSFELDYFYETEAIELSTNTVNLGIRSYQGTISYNGNVYVWQTNYHTGKVAFNEDSYSINGTWKNTNDDAIGTMKGTCSEIE
jgi:hypothetical protein